MSNKVIRGPSVTIGDDVFPVPDLADAIQQSAIEDSESADTINETLIDSYVESDQVGREAIDRFCAAYCGMQFKTILRNESEAELLEALGLKNEESAPAQDGG